MSVVQKAHTEEEAPSHFPFAGTKKDLFPPICLSSHWDPTMILRHTLPDRHVPLPTDFRPWTRVCKKYVTSGPAEVAPMPPRDMVFPQGGEFYPPGRYSAAIDRESVLRTLDHPLDRWCAARQYIVSPESTMYKANYTVPRSEALKSPMIQELAMPQAVLRESENHCRAADDAVLWARSPRLFNNPTKQDKFGAEKYYALPGGKLDMPHGEAQVVPLTAQAARAAVPIPMPGGMKVVPGAKAAPAAGSIRPMMAAAPVGVSSAGFQAPA